MCKKVTVNLSIHFDDVPYARLENFANKKASLFGFIWNGEGLGFGTRDIGYVLKGEDRKELLKAAKLFRRELLKFKDFKIKIPATSVCVRSL